MTINLADRVTRIKPSATLAISAKTTELRAQGRPIINLSVGEPDFDTPQHIKQAAIEAINNGLTKYTPVPGIPDLRRAITKKFKHDNGLDYQSKQVIVSNGAKQSIYNICQAVLNNGDEVIIPAPYWVSYPAIAQMAGATPVPVMTKPNDNFKITPEQLEQAITERSRMIILNSPSNPTGAAYSKDELSQLGDVLRKNPKILIVSDDIYEHIIWQQNRFANIVMACPDLIDRTIVVNGVSKAYSMTGWRIGYAAGPEPIITAMIKVQSQSTSNPCSISQAAALEALTGEQLCVNRMVKAFKERHDLALVLLNKINGIQCQAADGAFYLFPRVQEAIEQLDDIHDDVEFASFLLDKANVSVVPGTAFGCAGYLRLSIAVGIKTLEQAIHQIGLFLSD